MIARSYLLGLLATLAAGAHALAPSEARIDTTASGWEEVAGLGRAAATAVERVRGRWIELEGAMTDAEGSVRRFSAHALEVTDAEGTTRLHPVRSSGGRFAAIPSQTEVEIDVAAAGAGALVVAPDAVRPTVPSIAMVTAARAAAPGANALWSNYAVIIGGPVNRGNFLTQLLTTAEASAIMRGGVRDFLARGSGGKSDFQPNIHIPMSLMMGDGFGPDPSRRPVQGYWRPSTCDWVFRDPAGWLAQLGANYEWYTSSSDFQSRFPLPYSGYIYVIGNSYCSGSMHMAEVGGRRTWLMNPTRNDLARLAIWGLGRNGGLTDSGVLNCAAAGDLSSCVRAFDINRRIVDPFDAIGLRYDDGGRIDFPTAPPDFSARSKWKLGWLTESVGTECANGADVCTFQLAPGTKFFERTWELVPAGSGMPGTKLVRIPAPDGWYSLELRIPEGNDALTTPRPDGVYLRREGIDGPAVLVQPLLPGAFADKRMMWRDPASKLSIGLLALDPQGALVYARFGDKPTDACERARPRIESIEAVSPREFNRPGDSIMVRVTVRSNDPAACGEDAAFTLAVTPPEPELSLPWTVTPAQIPAITLAPGRTRTIEVVINVPTSAATNRNEVKFAFSPEGRPDLRDEQSTDVLVARAPKVESVFNAATWIQYAGYDGKEIRTAEIAPGSLVTLKGDGLGKPGCGSEAASDPPPTVLCGARVIARKSGGSSAEFALPLKRNRAGEIQAQYPFEGLYELAVELASTDERSNWITPKLVDLAPGIFRATPTDPKSGIVLRHPDYARVTSNTPVERGGYLIVYLTGLGQSSPPIALGAQGGPGYVIDSARVFVRIDGQTSTVSWAGKAPGAFGVDQVNIQVPANVGPGRRTFRLCAGATCSPDVDVWVR